jgi:hypothetical protein
MTELRPPLGVTESVDESAESTLRPFSQLQSELDPSSDSLVYLQSELNAVSTSSGNSPLSQSLLAVANHPNCPSVTGFFDKVAIENQPRRVSTMPDNADYFVDTDGNPLLLVFPAELDMEGRYCQSSVYFNLPNKVS